MSEKKKGKAVRNGPVPFELRLRAVKLYLEEGYTRQMVSEELGIGQSTLTTWAQRYRKLGEAGLEPRPPVAGKPKVEAAVKAKAVELKRREPQLHPPQTKGGL